MNQIKYSVSFLFVFTFVCLSAEARFYLDPYLGGVKGDADTHFTGDDGTFVDWSGDYSALKAGTRIGIATEGGFMFGADVTRSLSQEFDFDIASGHTFTFNTVSQSNFKAKVSQTDLGVFVGFAFPSIFRIWATYFIVSNIESDESTDVAIWTNGMKFGGSGFGGGFGVKIMQTFPLSLNFEYRSFDYDPERPSGSGYIYTSDIKTSEMMLAVSFPIGAHKK